MPIKLVVAVSRIMNNLAFISNLHASEILYIVFLLLLIVIPVWFIFKRIGWSPALSLFAAIPGVLIIILYAMAFGRWKETRGNADRIRH